MSAAGKMCHKSYLCLFDEGAARGGHLHMLSVSHSLFTWRMNSVRKGLGRTISLVLCIHMHEPYTSIDVQQSFPLNLGFSRWLIQEEPTSEMRLT